MRNIALKLSYNGTCYHGWQRQKNAISVQETLENALSSVFCEKIKVTGCGRTDAGVHALCYCANFKTSRMIPDDRIHLAVNSLLPPDISVSGAVTAEDNFNAILSCIKKEYTYKIYNARVRNPFYENFAFFYPQALNCDIMLQAAEAFIGTHDFRAVRSVGTETKSTVRTVYYFETERKSDMIILRVCADGFLYNMARALVGTLIYASLGKISPKEIPRLMIKGDRKLMGPTAPPQGLYMSKVWYKGVVGELMS